MKCRGGYSLLEMTIAVTVMAIFLGALATVTVRSSEAYEEGSNAAELDAGLHRALDVIVRELEDVGRSQLLPQPVAPNFAAVLRFRLAAGYADDAIQWGEWRQIGIELEPGELDDGMDNDGDGLVDERRVVWTEAPGTLDERRRVLVGGVRELDDGEIANGVDDDGDTLLDEPGLTFVLQGDVLRVRLCIEGIDERGVVRTRSAETSIHIRNDAGG